MRDPIVEEVRKARDEHARAFDYDLAAICADIRKHQRECGHPLVRCPLPDANIGRIAQAGADGATSATRTGAE